MAGGEVLGPHPRTLPHASLVGGDARPQAADRVQRAFGSSALEWERGWRVRKLHSQARRIKA